MPIEIVTVPCLSDNYAYLVHNSDPGTTALIDVPEASPIQSELENRGWRLTEIVLTHHHFDHVQGLDALRGDARVIGARTDAARLPALHMAVSDGDTILIAGTEAQVFDVSGHTVGHIALYLPEAKAIFTADSLMTMGCGRLFEGTPKQMWHSLSRLRALPADTRVYTGHEYTQTNVDFALALGEPNRALKERAQDVAQARADGRPTTGATLETEIATNPFLRADAPELARALNMEGSSSEEVFAEIRTRRDAW